MSSSVAPVVTIDGPSASGKSSVSRELTRRMGWKWVSTGIFYRGLAYLSQAHQVDPADEPALVELLGRDHWEVRLTQEETQFWVEGQDVTSALHQESIGMLASQLSQHPEVRKELLQQQRDCVSADQVLVAEGRDCGSVVFPNAAVKVYLTASLEHRALRRSIEEGQSVESQRSLQQKRDESDAKRPTAPMQVPEGGHVVDSSSMELSDAIDEVEKLVRDQFQKQNLQAWLGTPSESSPKPI